MKWFGKTLEDVRKEMYESDEFNNSKGLKIIVVNDDRKDYGFVTLGGIAFGTNFYLREYPGIYDFLTLFMPEKNREGKKVNTRPLCDLISKILGRKPLAKYIGIVNVYDELGRFVHFSWAEDCHQSSTIELLRATDSKMQIEGLKVFGKK